jgi:DnaJ-domain-containing protein 1
MSIPRRLLRIATEKLKTGIDGLVDEGWVPSYSRPGGTRRDARRELEDFLNDPVNARAEAQAASRPRPPLSPLAAEFKLLGLEPTAEPAAVHQAWRRFARENHPDRFTGDPPAQKAAQERFVKAQEAYERILDHLGGS